MYVGIVYVISNIFLLCHPIFGISGKEQHGSVKIIWGSHRDGGRAGGATCQWAIISGVLGGRIVVKSAVWQPVNICDRQATWLTKKTRNMCIWEYLSG